MILKEVNYKKTLTSFNLLIQTWNLVKFELFLQKFRMDLISRIEF